ncbi:ATP-dependent DNA helicase [Bifidobacterium catulorum]|uniref:DNA 3'-5' helicase n=1 Tax=Bifidobacterium catulorum TaxID=1630173 RepID=A0A2U2MQH9_9BIFI|nr:ATP-dependent DNA helicase [Bifidobacterium catulorum]PWG59100.1 ATP-dependent DNA helicase [Bifidobacterium catulorum]
MTTFTDTAEQAAVINAPEGEDVLVVAGAGSGKTYTMTRRVISLIERGVPAERILGLTFTRKAASELLSRVSAAVMEHTAADGAESDAEAGADSGRAFLKPDILTYDAFFQSIVRQYGLLVGMDQNTQPLSEAGAYQLAGDVVGKHMAMLFDAGRDADQASDTAPSVDDGDSDPGAFSTLTGQLMALSHAIADAMIGDDAMTFHDAVERVRRWDSSFIERLSTVIGDTPVPQKEPKVGKPPRRLKKDTDDTYAKKLDEYRGARREAEHLAAVYRCGVLLSSTRRRELLLTLAEEFQQAKKRANMAEFSDFTLAAFQLVRRFPSIGEEYRRRYSHVFLDEYQDTSTTQATLLAALFHVEHDGGPRTAVNAVGDPFQSIYAWRGASPGAFRMFQQDFGMAADRRPYALSQTRRNSRIVLEAANDLTIPLRRPPLRRSSSLMHEVDVAALHPMETAPLGTIGVQGYTNLGQEIDAVVRFAQQAIALHGTDAETGERRPGTHVAVLFRSKAALPDYRDALEAAGLTCEVVGYSALLERPEVRDLMALLHAVADHTDTAALMRLMATPRFGIGADDLKAVAALADRRNLEYRYRALVEAGLASAAAPRGEWPSIVAAHRDDVPNGVFLADLLMEEDVRRILESSRSVSGRGVELLVEVSRMLRCVESSVHRPLADILHRAVEALGLDIDCIVARSMSADGVGRSPADVRASVDAVVDLAATYLQELPDGLAPSLRGFVSWVDALGTVPEMSRGVSSGKADVTLMTVHQAKGLEWDAVAVVGLKQRGFPSSQGDNLAIGADDGRIGGVEPTGDVAAWNPPEYHETARTWLEDPTAVPAPMRVDAAILPRFPHDLDAESDPVDALAGLDSAERIADEAFAPENGDGDRDDIADSARFLSQQEEYGRRLHADERRLMYVALTRARHDALLTFSVDGRSMSCVPDEDAKPLNMDKASNFWMEVHEAFAARADAVSAPTNVDADDDAVPESLPRSVAGLFVGDHAREYENAVVGEAWLRPTTGVDAVDRIPWPRPLDAAVSRARRLSARDVTRRRHIADDSASPSGTLLAHARRLVEAGLTGDEDRRDNRSELERLRAEGERILASGRQNVTAIQARSSALGHTDDPEAERRLWAGIVRPVPRMSSPTAEAGTVFHDWAARFICPDGGDAMTTSMRDDIVASRSAMIDDVMRESSSMTSTMTSATESPTTSSAADPVMGRRLLVWKRRLIASSWARRRAAWAERSIVAAIEGRDGRRRIVNGKLDAVFHGGLDPDDPSKRFTVVDWKTGRRPYDTQDIADRLAQLDMYRLLLSRIEGVPLAGIDATLYYLSVDDEAERELHALPKDETEIIGELDGGMPPQSDND